MKNEIVKFSNLIEIDNEYFFSASNMNVLLHADRKIKEMEVVLHFEEYPEVAVGLHSKIERYKDKLFFFPKSAKGIHLYDMEKKRQRYIAFDEKFVDDNMFCRPFRVGNSMWIISRRLGQYVVRFDMEKEELFYEKEIANSIGEMVVVGENRTFMGDSVKEDKLYIGILETNNILELDIKDKIVRRINLNERIRLRNVHIEGNYVWCVVFDESAVYKYDMETEKMLRYSYNDINGDLCCFVKVVMSGKEKYITDKNNRYIYKVDEESGKLVRIDLSIEVSKDMLSVNEDINLSFNDEKYIINYEMNKDITLYKYPTSVGVYEVINFKITGIEDYLLSVLNDKIRNIYSQSQILFENEDEIELEFFLESINDTKYCCNVDKEIGDLIFDAIKKENENVS